MNELITRPGPSTPSSKNSETAYGYGGDDGPFARYYGYHGVQRDHPLREYIGVFLQHWLLVFGLGAIGLALAMMVNHTATRIYQANSLVNIGSYVPPEDGPVADMLRSETTRLEYADSQLPLLKSYLIAKKVLSTNPDIVTFLNPSFGEQLRRATEAGVQVEIPFGMLDQYLSQIVYSRIEATSMVHIYCNTSSATMAARIADAHAEAFIAVVREQLSAAASVNLEYLRARATEASARAREKEAELLQFSKDNAIGLIDSDGGTSVLEENYRGVIGNLAIAVQERASVEGELRELRSSAMSRDGLVSTSMQPSLLKLTELEGEYALMRKFNRNPAVLGSIDQEIRSLRDALKRGAEQDVKEAQIRQKAIVEREKLLRQEFENLKISDSKEKTKRLEYRLLEKESEALKTVEKETKKRLDDAIINAENSQRTVTLIDPAVPPGAPISPREKSNLITGALFGVLMGLVIAFFLAFSDNCVRTVAELKRLTGCSVLGIVPAFSKRTVKFQPAVLTGDEHETRSIENDLLREQQRHDEESARNRLVLVSSPLSRESESFRHIRTTLKLSTDAGAPKVTLVTSGQKGDGKTTLAANLAVSFAQTGVPVLLMDCDLRLPSVQRYFDLPRSSLGLVDYLAGEVELEKAIMQSGVENLDLFLSGSATRAPAEVLGGQPMAELIKYLSVKYHYVIIDSPPVAHVTDALLISPNVDAVALVVRSGKTPKPVAEFAVHRLRQVNANLIGTILNDVRRTAAYREAEYYFVGGDYYYSNPSS